MSNNYDDMDYFVNMVGRKQEEAKRSEDVERREKLSIPEEVGPKLEEVGPVVESVPGRRKKNNIGRIIGITAFTTAVSIAAQVCMTAFDCYNIGVKKATDDVYSDIASSGEVFKNEDGRTWVADGLDDMGRTAWREVSIDDYQRAKDTALSYGHSEVDVYTAFNTLSFNGFKDIFPKEERPTIENVAEYIDLGWATKTDGRGRK